jgi:putative protein kinase ArgK-like GTPase of G3E family
VGIRELLAEIRRHRTTLETAGALAARRRARLRGELESLLLEAFRARVRQGLAAGALRAKLDEVVAGDLDPYSAVEAMLPMVSLDPA